MNVVGICPGCGHRVAVVAGHEAVLACPSCATLFPVTAADARDDSPVVVVAHASEEVLDEARRVLHEAGYRAVLVPDAETARVALATHRPAALLVDVALPGALAHEWLPALREDPETRDVKVVLIASVHNATAYKRAPTHLHGADAWVEAHRFRQTLVGKLQQLVTGLGETA